MSASRQSALDAASGSGAELIGQLGSALYLGGALIFAVVMVLAVHGVLGRARPVNVRLWVLGGGLIFPAITLTALLVYSLIVGNAVGAIGSLQIQRVLQSQRANGQGAPALPAPAEHVRIHVVGKQWWWEVRYELPGAATTVVLANELHIPVDRPVEILLSSGDVIHSFWVPALAGKVDMIPGRTTRLMVQTREAGVFRGQCAEYCGGQHARMAFFVIATPEEQFAAWLARQARPAHTPVDPFLKLGYDSFFKAACHECHTVRGTRAMADLGPDLTHVGSRRSLAAGTLRNHVGTMAGWIAGPQEVKPGNRMPATDVLSGQELRALSAWLEGLE